MGNADSKAAKSDQETVGTATIASKQSKDHSRLTEFSSYDGGDDRSRRTPEKREADKHNVRRNGSGSTGRDEIVKKITDDQVHVNMAMADLMAYLQVVANNSNQLPLTRRDDPELDRTVSSLTSEDYARKSAAFVPSDVRVIGGTFTRYGRVWDLPTSEVRSMEKCSFDVLSQTAACPGGSRRREMFVHLFGPISDDFFFSIVKRSTGVQCL